jgi:hypothetical protein
METGMCNEPALRATPSTKTEGGSLCQIWRSKRPDYNSKSSRMAQKGIAHARVASLPTFKILQSLMALKSNCFCADCSDPCAINVNLTHHTFICANCAIVHREIGHEIKNTAFDSFDPEEIAALRETTNATVNAVWLATRARGDCEIGPSSGRLERRHFLECKYHKGQWHGIVAAPIAEQQMIQSDFSTDVSDVGSPLPQMQWEPDRISMCCPQQIGGMPPELSWQTRQPAVLRKQARWATPQ